MDIPMPEKSVCKNKNSSDYQALFFLFRKCSKTTHLLAILLCVLTVDRFVVIYFFLYIHITNKISI